MDDLNVQQYSQENKPGSQVKNFFSLPKIIFIVLGLILLVELIYAIRVLTQSVPTLAARMPLQVKIAKISLNAPKSSYLINDVIPVAVNIDTGSQVVDGVDALIHYDPKILEVPSGGLIKGHILEEYPSMNVDPNKGLISISGISTLQNGFKGVGQFATINFKAKSAGRTLLTIDFKGKNVTTASNLVDAVTSKNILDQVNNLELNVQ